MSNRLARFATLYWTFWVKIPKGSENNIPAIVPIPEATSIEE
jgi:hypothetical protein